MNQMKKLDQLKKQLESETDFIKAAEIRDEIKQLEGGFERPEDSDFECEGCGS